MDAPPIGAEAFAISLPIHESDATRRDFGDVLVPTLTLRTPAESIVRNLALAADRRALLVRVQSENAPPGTYAIDLELLADFVAHVHAAIARGEGADDAHPSVAGTVERGPHLKGLIVYKPRP